MAAIVANVFAAHCAASRKFFLHPIKAQTYAHLLNQMRGNKLAQRAAHAIADSCEVV